VQAADFISQKPFLLSPFFFPSHNLSSPTETKWQQNKELRAMTTFSDQGWNAQCEKLVEFERNKGHCMVTQRSKEDKSLGNWVNTQRFCHDNNELRLDKIGFAWKREGAEGTFKESNDKLWHQQHEKLVEFDRKSGHCMVTQKSMEDKSLGAWVVTQRGRRANEKLGIDRKMILDEIGFAWKGNAAHRVLKEPNDKRWQSSVKSWSSLNEKMAIAWCHAGTRKTSL
jgi:hypothetical protein